MCSSRLGLGGTYVQQCFVCFFPPYLCAVFPNVQKQLNMSLLSYMSYQNHVGLQPANLVTAQHVLRRRRKLSVFFSHYFLVSSRIYTTSPFHPVFLRLLYTFAADGISAFVVRRTHPQQTVHILQV